MFSASLDFTKRAMQFLHTIDLQRLSLQIILVDAKNRNITEFFLEFNTDTGTDSLEGRAVLSGPFRFGYNLRVITEAVNNVLSGMLKLQS